jgi:hypothetical protein
MKNWHVAKDEDGPFLYEGDSDDAEELLASFETEKDAEIYLTKIISQFDLQDEYMNEDFWPDECDRLYDLHRDLEMETE